MPATVKTRDAGNKIVIAARALVVLVSTFGGYLKQKYGSESAIGLLIDAILALASLLPAADSEVIDYGGDNADVIEDPSEIAGIDPSLPAFIEE